MTWSMFLQGPCTWVAVKAVNMRWSGFLDGVTRIRGASWARMADRLLGQIDWTGGIEGWPTLCPHVLAERRGMVWPGSRDKWAVRALSRETPRQEVRSTNVKEILA